MNFGPIRRLRRAEASEYLKRKWGIDRAPATLAKLACLGGGPRFESAKRVPLYLETELDIWVQSIMSPLKSSTSDQGRRRLTFAKAGAVTEHCDPLTKKSLPTSGEPIASSNQKVEEAPK
jgi:hypothetical protein